MKKKLGVSAALFFLLNLLLAHTLGIGLLLLMKLGALFQKPTVLQKILCFGSCKKKIVLLGPGLTTPTGDRATDPCY